MGRSKFVKLMCAEKNTHYLIETLLIGGLILPWLKHSIDASDPVEPNKRITGMTVPHRMLHIFFGIVGVQGISRRFGTNLKTCVSQDYAATQEFAAW